MKDSNLRIYIGWDSREDIAYQVARHSILKNTKFPQDVEIFPLQLDDLRSKGFYWRDKDKLGSTEFTFSRFLIPELEGYNGWALFIDCDFLFLDDVQRLFSLCDDKYAVMCVQHDYKPKNSEKMDGQKQMVYPRKNWSSMVLWNCNHPSNKQITKELVNDSATTGQYLHRFSWLKDEEIGSISHEWNWLVGWYNESKDGIPRALHYTEGGPWFKEYEKCDYAVDWLLHEKSYLKQIRKESKNYVGPFDGFSPIKQSLVEDILHYSIDPEGKIYETSLEKIKSKVESMGNKVAAIDSEGGINYGDKGEIYDHLLEDFIHGSGGIISNWEREKDSDNSLVIRGLGGGSRKAIQHCWETKRTFYAIDTGYFGNGKVKRIHRVTKNALQHLGPIIERDGDRAKSFGYKFKKFTPGSKILICPPSEKVMELFGQSRPSEWVKMIIAELKKYTDRPIEIRLKPNRTERVTCKSIQSALASNVHCLITYNSIAAVEALMEGKPAIVLGPNAAQMIAETNLSKIENPKIPTRDEMDAFMAHLSYCQFTQLELKNGYAWKIINESS